MIYSSIIFFFSFLFKTREKKKKNQIIDAINSFPVSGWWMLYVNLHAYRRCVCVFFFSLIFCLVFSITVFIILANQTSPVSKSETFCLGGISTKPNKINGVHWVNEHKLKIERQMQCHCMYALNEWVPHATHIRNKFHSSMFAQIHIHILYIYLYSQIGSIK